MKCSKMTFPESHEMLRYDISRESHEKFQYDIFRTTWNVPIWHFQSHMKCFCMGFSEPHEMFQDDISRVTWNVAVWHFQGHMTCSSLTFPESHMTCSTMKFPESHMKCCSSKTKFSSMIYIPVVPSLDKCFYRFMNSANEFCKTLRHHWCMITEITNRSPLFMHLRPRIHLFW